MVTRKRLREEAAPEEPTTPAPPVKEQSLLDRLRNTWEFANLMQYICIFGKAVKIDEDFDIEVLFILAFGPEHCLLVQGL